MFVSLERMENENFKPGQSNEVAAVEDEIPTKLSDLNFDCLLKIFMPLSKAELMSTIECNEHFWYPVRYIFEKKYSTEILHISNNPHFNEEGESETIKYLKVFGDIITSLHLNYDENYRQFDILIESAIIKYCRTTLKRITFENAMRHAMIEITEPFEQMQKVKLVGSEFGELISNFTKWFPEAHSLVLKKQVRQTSDRRELLERHHPALRHFEIKNVKTSDLCTDPMHGRINDQNVATFIQLNPQLTSLSIACDKRKHVNGITFNESLMSAIEEQLNNLESFNIFLTNTMTFNLREIHCKKLNCLKICTPNIRNAINVPISFDNVDTLVLNCAAVEPDEIRAFLDRCKNVKRLFMVTLAFWIILNFETFSRIPALEELRFPIRRRHLDLLTQNVGDFLEKCKKLERLAIFVIREPIKNESMILDQLQTLDGFNGSLPKWSAKIINNAEPLLSHTLVIFRMRSEQKQ